MRCRLRETFFRKALGFISPANALKQWHEESQNYFSKEFINKRNLTSKHTKIEKRNYLPGHAAWSLPAWYGT